MLPANIQMALCHRKDVLVFNTVHLQQLRCNHQSHVNGSQPYMWAELLQVDDDTLAPGGATAAPVAFPPPPIGAQISIATNMQSGALALMPESMAWMGARFKQGLVIRDLILVTLLWNQRDTPGYAVAAGYSAFLTEIQASIAKHLSELATASSGPARDAVIQKIKDEVKPKITSAISDALSLSDKAAIAAGLIHADDLVDNAFVLFSQENVTRPFTANYGAGSANDFQLAGTLIVTVNPCEDELVTLEATRQAIFNTNGALKKLEGHESKPGNQEKIEKLEQELWAEQVKLQTSQGALTRCQQRILTAGNGNGGTLGNFAVEVGVAQSDATAEQRV